MPFLAHLEELRWHLIRTVVVLGVVFVAAFANIQWIMDQIILAPLNPNFITYRKLLCPLSPEMCPKPGDIQLTLQLLTPTEAFTRALMISFSTALIVCFPYLSWEVWRFVKPGLKHAEIKRTRGVLWPVSLLFFLGVGFSYMVIAPFSLAFFTQFTLTDQAVNQWRVGPTVSLIVQICFAGGLLFQMPIVAWVLARVGFITAKLMRMFRRHAVVVILIVAAILTPADVFSQVLLALPMLVLYEVSILIVAREERLRRKRQAREAKQNPPPPPPGTTGDDDGSSPPPKPEPPIPAEDAAPLLTESGSQDPPVVLPPIHSLPQHRQD